MKKLFRHTACLLLSGLLLGGGLWASASFEEFPDAQNHWGRAVLQQAVEDGMLQGFEDGTLRPDAPISEAEILALLTRVLNPPETVSPVALGLTGEEWYAETAGKAAALGLLENPDRLTGESLTRLEALRLLARAFQLTQAAPDYSTLRSYADWREIPQEDLPAVASLIHLGYVQGSEHRLRPGSCISRAEFVTLLYRILPQYQAAEGPALRDVQADTLLLRLWGHDRPVISGTTKLGVLILAGGSGDGVTLSPAGAASVDTLVLGDYRGAVTVSGNISQLAITGDNLTISLQTNLKSLSVSGSGNRVTAGPGVTVSQVTTDPYAKGNILILPGNVESLTLNGSNQQVTAGGAIALLNLWARDSRVDGSGSVTVLRQYAEGNTVTLPIGATEDLMDRGIRDVTVSLTGVDFLPVGQTLRLSAAFDPPLQGPVATGQWFVDGSPIGKAVSVNLSQTEQITFEHSFSYSREMNTIAQIEFRLFYETAQGVEQSLSAAKTVTLENHSSEYYDRYEIPNVLKRVTTGYQGDYTLAWAEANDYDPLTKELWINAKGYSSQTRYLVWINTTYQRVNIFEGSQGNWKLLRSNIVATGRKGDDTPVGVYTVTIRHKYGWTTSDYHVSPVVRFKEGSGLAFHSRKYDPKNQTKLIDPSIGYPVSLGCIRMYDADIDWIYDTIPQHTTVVVY